LPRTSPSLDFDAVQPAPRGGLAGLLRSGLKMRMRLLIFFGLAVMVVGAVAVSGAPEAVDMELAALGAAAIVKSRT